jgi:glycosyltransferase involved in cell wall biosynthesis
MRLSKIFPSLSCGVPVIHSENEEAADVLRDNQCGVTLPPEDSQALADAIQQLTADGERRADVRRTARKFVESGYSWKIIVSCWIQEFGVTS